MQIIQNVKTNHIGLVDEIYAPQIHALVMQANEKSTESEDHSVVPHGNALSRFMESSCDCV